MFSYCATTVLQLSLVCWFMDLFPLMVCCNFMWLPPLLVLYQKSHGMFDKDHLNLAVISPKAAIISSAEKEHWELSFFFLKTERLVEIYTIFWLSFKSQLFSRDSLCSREDTRSLSCNEMPECQAEANLHHVSQ